MKAYFFQRVFAYAIDIIIVSVILFLFTVIVPVSDNYEKLTEEQILLAEQYLNKEVEAEVYIERSTDINYDLAKENFLVDLVRIVIVVSYFVIFQFYRKGQTLGKMLLKIKIIREDGKDVQVNDLIIRSVILYEVLANMLVLSTLLFLSAKTFFYVMSAVYFVQIVVIIVTLGMVCFRKDGRGLHDFAGKTKVVLLNKEELVVCEN